MHLQNIYIVFMFLLGACIGSFLNVCIYRIPRKESILLGASHCPMCNNKIKYYDLIPIISLIFLKDKCRYCGRKIPLRYFFIELFTGVFFTYISLKYKFTIDTLRFCMLSMFLIVIGIIDYDTTDVYSNTIIVGIICGTIFLIANYYYGNEFWSYIYGAILGGSFLSFIILITNGIGMGWGDAEACALCGLYLGIRKTLLMIVIAFTIGSVIGSILLLINEKYKKTMIPFVPFLSLASFFTIIYGDKIIRWYMLYM